MEPEKTDYMKEAEVKRLLTTANFRRMKENYTEAEELCRQAINMAPKNPEVHEIMGDIMMAVGKAETALTEYQTAIQLSPGTAVYETKYAKAVLAVAQDEQEKALVQGMIDNPNKYAERKHSPTFALLSSLAVPGLGQLYNGDRVKAAILFGIFIVFLLAAVIQWSYIPDANNIQRIIDYTHPIVVLLGALSVSAWIYGIIEAPFTADKKNKAKKNELSI